MEIYDFDSGADARLVVALGFFDCMHLGHVALLRAAERIAGERKATAALLTFRDFAKGGRSVLTLSERLDRMAELGAGGVIVAPFDERMRETEGEAFLARLVGGFDVAGAVCGADYRFGAGARGDAALLCRFFSDRGGAEIVPDRTAEGARVSTSRIKALLSAGDVAGANRLLGSPYRVKGRVEEGRKVGRTLGFPTLNFSLPADKFLPADGVYAAHAEVDGRRYNGLANLGARPTFDIAEKKLEVWLKDFSGDLYGRTVTVFFDDFLRPIERFRDVSALRRRLEADMRGVQ